MKALLLENVHSLGRETLEKAGVEVTALKGALDEDELIEALEGVDVLGIRSKTQVTARVDDPAATYGLAPELRAIVALCVQPVSVAEISARLRLHLGVTRILVGDLRAAGQLDVHVLDNETPDPETIMRVIRGLRSIT